MLYIDETTEKEDSIQEQTKEIDSKVTTAPSGEEGVVSPTRPTRGNYERRKRSSKYKKHCWLCKQGRLLIDYKDTELLKNYLRRYNKILIHKVSGNCLKHQHQLAQAIKRARFIGLLPFVPD